MTDVFVYTPEGALIMVLPKLLDLEWESRFREAGEVKVQLLSPHPLTDLLYSQSDLVFVWQNKYAMVSRIVMEGSTVTIHANELLTLLERRIIPLEVFSFSGTAEHCVRQILQEYAPYIQIQPQTDCTSVRTVQFDKSCDLLTAAKACLEGTDLGMKIEFIQGKFVFSFIYGQQKVKRLSEENKNVRKSSLVRRLSDVRNASYYTAYFTTTDVSIENKEIVENGNPNNFMQQFYITESITLDGKVHYGGTYLYCDTADGVLKTATEPQTYRILYIALMDKPWAVFEEKQFAWDKAQAETWLNVRKFAHEVYTVLPQDTDLQLGDKVQVEKRYGIQKGLLPMQVRAVKWNGKTQSVKMELQACESFI